jgi:hypothetical protein
VRSAVRLLALLAVATPLQAQAAAQSTAPSGLAALETARSKSCVSVLNRLDVLNQSLQPLGLRSERLRAIARAIALEDRTVVDSLQVADPTEAAVRAWFERDGALAQRFVETRDSTVLAERGTGREAIKATVGKAIADVQAEAQAVIDASGDLTSEANPCDGAILVRPAVLEACATEEGAVCDAARSEAQGPYRFVESANDLWDVQELRPWTEPGPLQVAQNGQLIGARTIAFARQGNVVVTVALAPLIQQRDQLGPEEVQQFEMVLDSLGFDFDHPDLVFVPSLAIRATIPEPLAGETLYLLHFGPADSAQIVFTAKAGTGSPIEAPVVLNVRQLQRLVSGEVLNFTALREIDAGNAEALYTIALTPVAQATQTRALLGYMSKQLGEDLKRLIPPTGG